MFVITDKIYAYGVRLVCVAINTLNVQTLEHFTLTMQHHWPTLEHIARLISLTLLVSLIFVTSRCSIWKILKAIWDWLVQQVHTVIRIAFLECSIVNLLYSNHEKQCEWLYVSLYSVKISTRLKLITISVRNCDWVGIAFTCSTCV